MLDYFFIKLFTEPNALQQQQISHQTKTTAITFKRICYADVTSYPIKFLWTGTLFTKVTKIIDQHDRLLRYCLLFSKHVEESNCWDICL